MATAKKAAKKAAPKKAAIDPQRKTASGIQTQGPLTKMSR